MMQHHQWTISLFLFFALSLGPQAGLAKTQQRVSCENDSKCKPLNQEALQLFSNRDYPEALAKFQAAYAIAQSDSLLLSIGRTLFRLKDYEGSLEYLTRYRGSAQVTDPETKAKGERYFAEVLAALKKFNQLRDDGMRALTEQRFPDALTSLEAAFELKPDPELLVGQGRALQALSRHEEAIRKYLQYLDAPSAGDRGRRQEVSQLLKAAEAAAAAAVKPETPATSLPCAQDPACASTWAQSPPPRGPSQTQPPAGLTGRDDHDLDLWNGSQGNAKSTARRTGLWVGLSIGGAVLLAAVIGGAVYATQNSASGGSATQYSVTWR